MAQRKTLKEDKDKAANLLPVEVPKERPIITLDYELYAHFLDDENLPEEQKHELLQLLWNIVVECVSLGFGVHPLQQAKDAYGQADNKPSKPALMAPNEVYLDHKFITENFSVAANRKDDSEGVVS